MQYTPTEAITNNSMRGLALLQKSNSIKSKAIQTEIEPYVNLLNKGLTKDQVQGLYFALLKARDNYQPKTLLEGYNVTPDTAKFLSLGANAAIAWCSDILQDTQVKKQAANTEDEIRGVPLPVIKSVNEEMRIATFVVLEPQDDDGTTNDLHGDWYDAKTVEESCINFNRFCKKASLLHLMPTSAIEFVESYIQRCDCSIDGKFIKKGTWLATIYVDTSPMGEEIWQGIKNGTFNGLSIQCLGQTEVME